jgi:hypothetical protein
MNDATTTPPVWKWYLAYAISLAIVYVVCALSGVVIIVAAYFASPEERVQLLLTGSLLFVFCVPFAGAVGAVPFLPRKPWAWTYHLVMICMGMTSACCLPACIPLLIFWLKPETKAMFNAT